MAVKKEFESFDEFAEMLQEEENRKRNAKLAEKVNSNLAIKQETTTRTLPQARRYYRKTTGPVVISIEEYRERVKNGSLPATEEKHTPISEDNNSKNLSQKSQKSTSTPKKKIKLKKAKPSRDKQKDKPTTREERNLQKKRQRKIATVSKQVKQNVARQTRFTEPKKRNILKRIILQQNLASGVYENIEYDYDTYSPREIEESKNAKKRRDRWLYKEVQAYEDARDDVTTRKDWRAFKIGLGAALLAGSLALGSHLANEVKQTLTPTSQTITIETMDAEEKEYYENKVEEFKDQIRANDGYEFDYLSDEEFLDGYLKIYSKEKKMYESQFSGALYDFKDQEKLDSIVSRCFGEEEYSTFSDEQKRDYRQLAFELLPVALPDVFETNQYIRNPIVCDELQARDSAKEKGYKISLVVNGDEEDTVRTIGKLIHIRNILKSVNIQAIATGDGQEVLEDMVKQALGEQYENVSEKDLRDYKQIAYELLPDEVKGSCIKDPIELEKAATDIEIGD